MSKASLTNEDQLIIVKNLGKSGEDLAKLLTDAGHPMQQANACVYRKRVYDSINAYAEKNTEAFAKMVGVIPAESDLPHCCEPMLVWSKNNRIPTIMKFCPFCGKSIVKRPYTPSYMKMEVDRLLKEGEAEKVDTLFRELMVDLGYKDVLHALVNTHLNVNRV